jgi:hypothetical protein
MIRRGSCFYSQQEQSRYSSPFRKEKKKSQLNQIPNGLSSLDGMLSI